MARPERFELPTFWFVARHSIQLSYGRADTKTGGERGIRTLEGLLALTPLAGARLRPLGHLSVSEIRHLGSGRVARRDEARNDTDRYPRGKARVSGNCSTAPQ